LEPGGAVVVDAVTRFDIARRLQAGAAGRTLAAIADRLNADAVSPAGRGKRCYASSVKAVLDRREQVA
jgi:hypothetical protein